MKILDLLKDETGWAYVQGIRTRLLLSGKLFEVFSKTTPKGTSYAYKNYEGYNEEEAVSAFIKSEMKGI